ncbi:MULTISPECIES: OsmC family protein [unclassified Marinobacter]|uniref:OsmC family protein n=1 Tax=unclassified Marinobacter TaxID=83889 RepID=UPI000C01C8E9|nr:MULTISPECIES: OsmC family protein [unclassified Marinobacter]PFG10365.1 putative OsmC-like protein [Marinobacter sp. LV10MA510-1]PFG52269.1 putative OsmC-like protein [Marinobacter sp. LV10R520-4]
MDTNILEVAARSEWRSGLQTHSQIRGFDPVVMDEPKALGGQDQGPNPLEYLVASLNGCKGVMIPLVAKELNFEFSELTFDTKGMVDLRGLMGQPDVSTHFQSLTFAVNIKTDESAERLQMLQDAVAERCPVYNLLRDASVSMHTQWTRI